MAIRIYILAGNLIIVAAMAIALGLYFGVIPFPMSLLGTFPRTAQSEFSARYYPADTAAYTWVTLAPRGRQIRDMREIWRRFNEYPGFVRAVHDWKSGFSEETGISFDEDVATWIGPELSAGLLGIDAETRQPDWAVLIGVRDEDAAADFLDKWIVYVAAKGNVAFDTRPYQDHPTWISEVEDQNYALTDDWLVYATNEAALRAIIDRIENSGEGSLARDAKFQAAREALADRRFASTYVDYDRSAEIIEMLESQFAPVGPGLLNSAIGSGQTTEWVGVAATWVDRGIVTEWVTPSDATDGLDAADLDDPAGLLPKDTLGFVAAAFDPDVDNWRAALADRRLADVLPEPGLSGGIAGLLHGGRSGETPQLDADSSLAEALDLGLVLVKDNTGIDLETEFFDHLAGTAILAVRDFDFSAVGEDAAGNPVDAVAMLAYKEGSRDDLENTMSRMSDLVRTSAGLSFEMVDVGADEPATVFDLGSLGMLMGGETGYRPGYVLHDQYLTIGTTERALTTAVELQNGQGESLSSNAEYQRAMEYLPDNRRFLSYIDAHRIIDQLDEEDLRVTEDEYEAIRDGLGVFVLRSDDGKLYRRGSAVVTLFPE